jgi:isocitrate dehydrogenase
MKALTKIRVQNPVVVMNGDEMARIMWKMIREKLIIPFIDIPILDFDLSIQSRELTHDQVTIQAAEAIKVCDVGIKCATITPDLLRVKEFNLSRMWPSPNGTIRNMLDGTIFREPIVIGNIPRLVPGWTEPFIVARHGFGDQYKSKEVSITEPGTLSILFSPKDLKSQPTIEIVHEFTAPGIGMSMFNTDHSIRSFARSCFGMAIHRKMPVYLSTKNTILKIYDGRFKDIFEEVYQDEFKAKMVALNLGYEHKLIDDMVAFALKSSGGFIWACKNYDGDVQSDSAAQGFGSLGLMTSVLVTPDGRTKVAEAAHGTVTKHYRQWQREQEEGKGRSTTSTNPIASIFAWTTGLKHRAELDGNEDLQQFCVGLEECVLDSVRSCYFTKDLARLHYASDNLHDEEWMTTEDFLDHLASRIAQYVPTERRAIVV